MSDANGCHDSVDANHMYNSFREVCFLILKPYSNWAFWVILATGEREAEEEEGRDTPPILTIELLR